jgi:uncharacterized protein (TIGR04141 family)
MSKRPKTSERTLYRLAGVTPTLDGLFDEVTDHIGDRKLDALSAQPEPLTVHGHPAIWIGIPGSEHSPDWCADAAAITGLRVSYLDRRAAGILLIAVDSAAYAMTFGAGYPLLPDEIKDQRFGLSFIIRRLDPDQVHDLVRRRPEGRGRTETTTVPGGAPVWTLGIQESIDIIRRAGGWAKDLKVTFAGASDRPVKIEGSAGLRMRFGVDPPDLIADIRECDRVCREEEPHEAFAFIDNIRPIADADTRTLLDIELDDLLGTSDGASQLLPVVPTSVLDAFREARSFSFKIGGGRAIPQPSLELEHILARTRNQSQGSRLDALRAGYVNLHSDDTGRDTLDHARADKWLEVSLALGAEQFFLLDGEWYEIGDKYAENSRHEITTLFTAIPSLDLPPWRRGDTEGDYNRHVADARPGAYLCLDKNRWIRNPLGRWSPLEICDLLGPHNELIHVKRAKGSEPLSHLFFQGLISAQSLLYGPSHVKTRFLEEVAKRGRTLDVFTPQKVVFAILMDNGKQLTRDTLFPFSQATLAHVARTLHTYRDIDVEVIGIPSASLHVQLADFRNQVLATTGERAGSTGNGPHAWCGTAGFSAKTMNDL